jgi:hypothetical protein
MRVWIEPIEWDTTEGPTPIAQLDITATSYLQDEEVRGVRAISGAADGCMTLYGLAYSLLMTFNREYPLVHFEVIFELRRYPL